MTGPLVLPKDVQIVSLASLSANVRARIAGENHEFALTRRIPARRQRLSMRKVRNFS